jgi:hypothetical protein
MSLKNPLTPPEIDPGTFRLVAQRLKHYATPGPHLYFLQRKNYSKDVNILQRSFTFKAGRILKGNDVVFFVIL